MDRPFQYGLAGNDVGRAWATRTRSGLTPPRPRGYSAVSFWIDHLRVILYKRSAVGFAVVSECVRSGVPGKLWPCGVAAWLAAAVLGFGMASAASAMDFAVTDFGDTGGPNQLRTLITNANPGDTIHIGPGPITLKGAAGEDANASGDLDIGKNLTIIGAGPGQTLLDGDGKDRVFDIFYPAAVSISKLTIQNGRPGAAGGGIRSTGTVMLDRVTMSHNMASPDADRDQIALGGCIASVGDPSGPAPANLTIANSVLSDNKSSGNCGAFGGCIAAAIGSVQIRNTTIADNSVYSGATGPPCPPDNLAGGGVGGAIAMALGDLTCTNTVVSNNDASGDGSAFGAAAGGIANLGATLIFMQGSIEDNKATATGDGATAIGGGVASANLFGPFGIDVGDIDGVLGDMPSSATFSNSSIAGNRAIASGTPGTAVGGGITSISATDFVDAHAATETNGAALVITDCSVSRNLASASGDVVGGGIAAVTAVLIDMFLTHAGPTADLIHQAQAIDDGSLGTAKITNTTVSQNTAEGDSGSMGGGVFNLFAVLSEAPSRTGPATDGIPGVMEITNSTVSGNQAPAGAGIANPGLLSLNNVTITDNITGVVEDTGGGLFNIGIVLTQNTIIAGNTDPIGPDCFSASGLIISAGYNLIGKSDDCNWSASMGDKIGTIAAPIDPALGPLANNGGPTLAHALLFGSPAIDGGDPAGCTDLEATPLTTDQRGFPRPVDGDADGNPICDIGAFEAPVRAVRAPALSWPMDAVVLAALGLVGFLRSRAAR